MKQAQAHPTPRAADWPTLRFGQPLAVSFYKAVKIRKTHASMGSLFGWIFGKQSPKFMELVWALRDRFRQTTKTANSKVIEVDGGWPIK